MCEDEGDVGLDDVCKDVFIRLKRDVKRHEWIETKAVVRPEAGDKEGVNGGVKLL